MRRVAGPGEAVQALPLEVRARPGEAPEALIKRFTRLVRADGILKEHSTSLRFSKRRKKTRAK